LLSSWNEISRNRHAAVVIVARPAEPPGLATSFGFHLGSLYFASTTESGGCLRQREQSTEIFRSMGSAIHDFGDGHGTIGGNDAEADRAF